MRTCLSLVAAALMILAPGLAEAKLELKTKDGKWSAAISGRVQTRLTFEHPGADGVDDEIAFSIPRARLKVGGNAFTEGLEYALQVDFGKGKASLKDYYVDYFVNPHFGVRIGQMKMPFSRQQLTSSGSQTFVDRAITDKAFTAGRDVGLYVLSDYEKSNLEYAVGVFNGTGDNVVPSQFRPTVAARVGWHSDQMRGYKEADLEGGGFRWAVAGNAKINFDVKTEEPRDESMQAGADFALKAHGFSATGAFYLGMTGPTIGDLEMEAIGAHVQAGYVIKGVYMPAIRWSALMPEGDKNDVMEIQGAFNIFPFGSHNLKWTTDVTAVLPEEGDTDIVVRTQIQLAY